MTESNRPAVFVHLLPSLIAPGTLAGGVAVVVDVLRATTVMVRALAAGCEAVLPCGEIDEALAVAATLPEGTAITAGERKGLPIAGFDLGNSPDDFTEQACRGKTLVMTTTNGTRAILASLDAEHVGLGALVNENAVARWALSFQRPVHVVCAGTDGNVSLEDTLFAGALVGNLQESQNVPIGNDSAAIAFALHRQFFEEESAGKATWTDLVARGRGGKRVREIGLSRDVAAAARWNTLGIVPVLEPGRPVRLVRRRA